MTVLLFVFLEIASLLIVGSWIGVGWTLLLLLGGFVLGLALIGRGGREAMAAVNQAARSRGVADGTVSGGFLTVVAGALFMIPGFLSDLVALSLLLPPVRALARRRMSAWAQRRAATVQVVDLGGLTVGTWPGGPGGPAGPRVDPRFANSTVVDGSVVDGTVVDSTVVDSTVVDSTVVADTGTQQDRLPVRRPQ
ncbi:FxsA family protein [Nakamurella multipartita]|uniref:FxsA cytoplasmic membrane protein n=1 Tax=Nakamurella multipartita (strain ATCC 700099 / DSM 44233 / CIP 104796 / JCM 9543 / NBRC 105858 / Y-104) TaxID=479431 RepID=C8XAP8_NAKMY|nr:FxsA family protein [Nakamurella multipartita]ACV79301.1 FxsA cytoplasmic membrane protein [Nakamurella multipartita DSM 44233]